MCNVGGWEDALPDVQAARDVARRVPLHQAVPAGREGEHHGSGLAHPGAPVPLQQQHPRQPQLPAAHRDHQPRGGHHARRRGPQGARAAPAAAEEDRDGTGADSQAATGAAQGSG